MSIDLTEAIEAAIGGYLAAARVQFARNESRLTDLIKAAITAAAPLIERAVRADEREQVADQLEAWADDHDRSGNLAHRNALRLAAFLVRRGETNWPGAGDSDA